MEGQKAAKWQVELETVLDELEGKVIHLLEQVKQLTGCQQDERALGKEIRQDIFNLLCLPSANISPAISLLPFKTLIQETLGIENAIQDGKPQFWGIALTWLLVRNLGKLATGESPASDWKSQTIRWLEEWGLDRLVGRTFVSLGINQQNTGQAVNMVKLLTLHSNWYPEKSSDHETKIAAEAVQAWLADSHIREAIDLNLYQSILWFNKEKFEYFTGWMFLATLMEQWSR